MEDVLEHLDLKLKPISESIAKGDDHLCDYAEYLVGLGFTVIQQYMVSTSWELEKYLKAADVNVFDLEPKIGDGVNFFVLLNACANYWKHGEEWHNNLCKDTALNKQQQKALQKIEMVTPWEEYTCSNALAVMLDKPDVEGMTLSSLMSLVREWDKNIESFVS